MTTSIEKVVAALTDEWQDAPAIAARAGMEGRYGQKAVLYHALERAVADGLAQRKKVWSPKPPGSRLLWRRMP